MPSFNQFSLEVLFADQLATDPDYVVYVVDLSTKDQSNIVSFRHPANDLQSLVTAFNQCTVIQHNGTAPYLVPR